MQDGEVAHPAYDPLGVLSPGLGSMDTASARYSPVAIRVNDVAERRMQAAIGPRTWRSAFSLAPRPEDFSSSPRQPSTSKHMMVRTCGHRAGRSDQSCGASQDLEQVLGRAEAARAIDGGGQRPGRAARQRAVSCSAIFPSDQQHPPSARIRLFVPSRGAGAPRCRCRWSLAFGSAGAIDLDVLRRRDPPAHLLGPRSRPASVALA